MRVRVVCLAVIVVGLVISFGLAKNLYTAYQNSKILSDEQGKLGELRQENSRLKNEVSTASNPNYIDNEARKKLGLVKPGEVEVVIAQQEPATVAAQPTPVRMEVSSVGVGKEGSSVWKQWLDFLIARGR